MRTTKYYKVMPSVAERAGVAEIRYRTEDGMMILNEQDVRMVRLEPEEYLSGVVEAILTEEEAALLIEQGGRKMGLPVEESTEEVSDEIVSEVTEDVTAESEAEVEDNEETEVQEEKEVTNE